MNREFLINISILIGINLLVKPIYIFGIDRTVQNTVGEADYGMYFALFNFTYLFQIINDFGIQSFNNRTIAQHNQLLDKLLPNVLVLKTILFGIYLMVLFAFAQIAGYEIRWYAMLFFLGINWFLISLLYYLRTNISGLAMYRTDSLISSLDKFLLILICSYLLWFAPFKDQFRIEWFVYAQTATLVITNLVAFAIVFKHLKRFKLSLKPAYLISILRQSAPYALAIFLMILFTRIDSVMVERMLDDGKRQAGIYAAAFRLLDAFNMIGFLFSSLLLPMFAKMIKAKENVYPLFKFSFQLIIAGTITLALGTYFYQLDIMQLLYVNATEFWAQVMSILMFTLIALSGNFILGSLLTANGSLKQMNIIFSICVLLNIGFNLWLIPSHKALGAAYATCITQYFALFAQLFLATKVFKFRFDWALWAQIIGFFAILWAFGQYAFPMLSFSWHVNFIGFILVGILLSFITRLIDPIAFFRILKDQN